MRRRDRASLVVACAIGSILSPGCSPSVSTPPSRRPLFEVELREFDGLSFTDNLHGPYDDSQINLGEALERAQQATPPNEELLVRISAADAVSYGRLKVFIGLFVQRGIRKFELRFADELTYPFEAADEPGPGVPITRDLPPFIVRLRAAKRKTLDAIYIDTREVASFDALRMEMIARIGDERGPGSIAESAVVVMECDDEISVLFLRQAYAAVAGYRSADGEFVPLVKSILPMSLDEDDVADIELREVWDYSVPLD